MRRHKGNQRIHRRIIDGVRLNDAFFPLTGNLQRRFALPGIACQQNRLQVFIGFQQVVVEITVVAQALQIAAGTMTASTVSDGDPAKVPATGSSVPSSACTFPIRE